MTAKREPTKNKRKPAVKRGKNPRSKTGKWYEKIGRPAKLNKALLDKTIAYYQHKKDTQEMPFVEELAIMELDVDRSTVSRWHNKGQNHEWLKLQSEQKRVLYTQFCHMIKKLADLQLLHLKVQGGTEKFNRSVAIFLMKADHGMIETSRTELTGKDGKPIEYLPVEVLSTKGRGKKA